MTRAEKNKTLVGDCECCTKSVNVELFEAHGMKMCAACHGEQLTAMGKSAAKLIEESRNIDSNIQVRQDIYNAQTIAAVELRAAIEHDDSIPADEKDYAIARESFTRFKQFQAALIEKRQEVLTIENGMKVWQVNVQETVGKLRAELREQFKILDVSYSPAPVKKIKPVKAGKARKFKLEELKDAAKKYNAPVAALQMMAAQHNISPDEAGKRFASLSSNKAK